MVNNIQKNNKKLILVISLLSLELMLLLYPIYSNINKIYLAEGTEYHNSMDHLPHLINFFYNDPLKNMVYTLISGPAGLLLKGEIYQEPTLTNLSFKEEIMNTHPELKIFNSSKLTMESAALLRSSDYNLLFVIYSGFASTVISEPLVRMNLYFIITLITISISSFYVAFKETKSALFSFIISNTLIISNYIFFQFAMFDTNLFTIFPAVLLLYFIYKIKENKNVRKYYYWAGFWLGLQLLTSLQISYMLLFLILLRETLFLITHHNSVFKDLQWKKIIAGLTIAILISVPQILITTMAMLSTPHNPIFDHQTFITSASNTSVPSIMHLFNFEYSHSLSISTGIIALGLVSYSALRKRWAFPILILTIILISFGANSWNIIYKLLSCIPLFGAFRVTKRALIFIPLFCFIKAIELVKEMDNAKGVLGRTIIMGERNKKIVFCFFLILDILYVWISPYILAFNFFNPFL